MSARIPVRRSHAGEGVVLVVLKVALFVHKSVADVDIVDRSNDETVCADFDGGVFGAFEGDGGLGDARDGNFFRGQNGEIMKVEFRFAMGEGSGGSDHDFAEGFIDHVDDELLGFANIARGVFWGEAVFVSGSKSDDGGIGAKNVEEGKRSGVEFAFAVLGGDPGDGAGGDEGGENAVAIAGRNFLHVKSHRGRVCRAS